MPRRPPPAIDGHAPAVVVEDASIQPVEERAVVLEAVADVAADAAPQAAVVAGGVGLGRQAIQHVRTLIEQEKVIGDQGREM